MEFGVQGLKWWVWGLGFQDCKDLRFMTQLFSVEPAVRLFSLYAAQQRRLKVHEP